MKQVSIFLLLFCSIVIFGQNSGSLNLNLDFENIENGIAKGWKTYGKGNYTASIDSTVYLSGNHSAMAEYKSGTPYFKAWAYSIPAIYQGNKIKLTGYLKTENVTDGYAGLWMRIDPLVSFDNMSNRGVTGTTGWKKYEIELDLFPSKAKRIVFGGLLTGKGKMWIDNLEITIDDKRLEDVPLKKLLNVEKDTAFVNGSKIDTIALDTGKIADLKALGLIWGFLKYYHPNIAKGDYNWDFELFKILPRIINCNNNIERDKIIIDWIKSLGQYNIDKTESDNKKADSVKMMPDLDWITNSGFSDSLVSVLTRIKNAERNGTNYYVDLVPGVKNPDFSHEAIYSNMKYPDAGFRLLALYRYWNIIQYYFPYKYLIGEDWKNVLAEFIPKFVNAANETDYKLAVLELIAGIHDTHANIWARDSVISHFWGVNYAPLEIKFIENQPVVTGCIDEVLGEKTGLIPGDIITKINHQPVSEIINNNLKYIPASNHPTQLRNLSRKLLRTNDTSISIEYLRDEKIRTATIKAYSTEKININNKYQVKDTCFKMINNNIAYLYPGSVKNSYLPVLYKKIKDKKGLIIDFRCYPSEFIVFTLGKYLMPDKTEFVKFSNGSIETPGLFTFTGTLKVGEKNEDYYKGKVIILVNEETQSQAEYTTMALQNAPNAVIMGSTTAGADGNISFFYLPGGIRTAISGIGVYYPDGSETQRIGIIPDIVVKPTINGIKHNRDEILQKAIELIEE